MHLRTLPRFVLLVFVTLAPAAARADGEKGGLRQELSLTVGYSTSSVTPARGGLLSVAYARPFGEHWSWLVRPEVVFNLQRPDGHLMKGAGFGLDAGVAWTSAPTGVRFIADAALGGRLLTSPGIGAVSRVEAGVSVPLAASLSLAVGLSGELGLAKVGDEAPKTEALTRADLWTRVIGEF